MKHRIHTFLIILGVLSLMATTLACSLLDVDQSGPSQNDLSATQVSLQATQLALEMIQLQATQQALAAQQGVQPTQQEAPPVQQDTQPVQQDAQPVLPDVSFDGVSFSYDDSLGRDVSTQLVPSDLAEDPYWGMPEHPQFELMGYPVQNDYHKAQVYVFPVDAYRAGNENAGGIIDRLQTLLSSRPADPSQGIPILPAFNAGEIGWAKVAYFDFQNGSGVRFVTELGQDVWPFTNQKMIYVYQGLTHDGRYYVSVTLPLSHPSLNEYSNYQPPDNFYEVAMDLVDSQVENLNNQPDESYFPSIAVLDAMVQSLKVQK